MDNPPVEGTPAPQTPDFSAVIEEQKAVIAALSEKIKNLEGRASSTEAKLTAMSAPAAPAPAEDKVAAAKSELDKAYDKVLMDLGIKKE